jgi:hypothetical protein
MDKDTHVYCTNCKNINVNLTCLESKERTHCSQCICFECECACPEDSCRFENRPNYVALKEQG